MFQVTRSGAWLLDGRLYKSLRIGLVSLRVCSGPQQTRLFVRVNDLAEILTSSPSSLLPFSSWLASASTASSHCALALRLLTGEALSAL